MSGADCHVFAAPALTRRQIGLLRRRERLGLHTPIVLLTSDDPENAKLLGMIRVDEVVWVRDADYALPLAIDHVLERSPLVRLARRIADAPGLAEPLRQALILAIVEALPISSVQALARAAGHSPKKLRQQWREVVPPDVGRLEDFLDWLAIIRAVALRVRYGSWEATASALNVPLPTLRGQIRRHIGLRPGELAGKGLEFAVGEFEKRIITPLVTDPFP
jgi:hypothetical protein